jgi:hypothetical protein
MKRTWTSILFWGALWGLVEATLGFVLHGAAVALPGIPGLVMFPLACLFLERVVSSTGRPSSAVAASLVAAAVKGVDFLVPNHDAIRIVNPALAILLEGLAAWATFAACRRAGMSPGPVAAFLLAFSWRVAFLGHLWVLSRFDLPAALVTNGVLSMLRFSLGESLANALPIAALFLWLCRSRPPAREPRLLRPALAASLLSAALAAEFLL